MPAARLDGRASEAGRSDIAGITSQTGEINQRVLGDDLEGPVPELFFHPLQEVASHRVLAATEIHGTAENHSAGIECVHQRDDTDAEVGCRFQNHFQRKGVAKILFTEMTSHLKKVGVDTIYTFVKRRDWILLKFFNSMGFQKGDMINLELDI